MRVFWHQGSKFTTCLQELKEDHDEQKIIRETGSSGNREATFIMSLLRQLTKVFDIQVFQIFEYSPPQTKPTCSGGVKHHYTKNCAKIYKPYIFIQRIQRFNYNNGGEGGIRTLEGLSPLPVFKTGAFNRSATSPK